VLDSVFRGVCIVEELLEASVSVCEVQVRTFLLIVNHRRVHGFQVLLLVREEIWERVSLVAQESLHVHINE